MGFFFVCVAQEYGITAMSGCRRK